SPDDPIRSARRGLPDPRSLVSQGGGQAAPIEWRVSVLETGPGVLPERCARRQADVAIPPRGNLGVPSPGLSAGAGTDPGGCCTPAKKEDRATSAQGRGD